MEGVAKRNPPLPLSQTRHTGQKRFVAVKSNT